MISMITDSREFRWTLKEYSRLNKRDNAVLLNAKALQLSFRALKKTPSAKQVQIRADLREIVTDRNGKPVMRAYAIVNQRRRKAGKPGASRKEMKRLAVQLIRGRVRSAGFLKSGWIPAVKKLLKAVPAKDRARDRIRGKPPSRIERTIQKEKGFARIARRGLNPFAEIGNEILPAQRVGLPAFRSALRFVKRDMHRYIKRKYRETAWKTGVKAL